MDLINRVVCCGENKRILIEYFPDECVDLIYLDPPFFSNKNYEILWGNGAELRVYEDRWKGGISHYVEWMAERLRELYRVLKPTGSIYLHCDWHASHYLKIEMDRIFGQGHFLNEVIWHYRTGNIATKIFARRHDIILVYTKSNKWTFNPIELKRYYVQDYGPGFKPGFKGRKHGKDEFGEFRIVYVDDVWDLSAVFTRSKEHLDYPTQKPEALLERIIQASSKEGDLILDPFVGGGTTLVVAERLKRRWVGIDVSPIAMHTIEDNLHRYNIKDYTLVGAPASIEDLKNFTPEEFQYWVINAVYGTPSRKLSSDYGIDGYTYFEQNPIQVKQSDKVGRNIIDNFETAIRRLKKKKGEIYAFSFTKGSYDEVARAKREEKLEIKLITVEDLLKQLREHK
ncbi:MAG: DNA methyltransferase [bacterium]